MRLDRDQVPSAWRAGRRAALRYRPLYAAMAHALEMVKRMDEHAEISNHITECKATIEAAEDTYNPFDVTMIEEPTLDPRLAEKYVRFFEKDGLLSHFLKASNLPLRMLKSGNAAIVSYQIVVPEALNNILVLDASFPIRKLCHFDTTIKSAETLRGLKREGVPAFHSLKRFDNVKLFRLKSYGGRFSMEKRFKDRQMAKEVVQVLKTIPEDEAVLLYVYKMNQPGGIKYKKILLAEISKAGIDADVEINGKPRIVVSTWGNEHHSTATPTASMSFSWAFSIETTPRSWASTWARSTTFRARSARR